MSDPATLRDVDAERVLIASLLIDAPGALAELAADGVTVAAGDYWRHEHGAMHAAIVALVDRGEAVDVLAVRDELVRRGAGESVAVHAAVLDVASAWQTSTGAAHAARRVVDCARRRALRVAVLATADRASDPTHDVDDTLSAHATSIEALRAGRRDRRSALILGLDELCSMPAGQWIVGGLVPAAAVLFLVGPPNCGKSVVALDWVMRVTRGEAWIDGRRIRAGSVVYCAGEGLAGLGARVRAWEQEHGGPAHRERFAVVRGLPPLSGAAGISELRAIVAEHAQAHGPVALVVVDTLATHWAESEDKSEHVGPCMRALADLAAEHGCSVLLVHHERKPQAGAKDDGWGALRGSGAWTGAADAVLRVEPQANSGLRLVTTKQRDGEKAPPIPLRILGVPLDVVDDEGHPITAPILVPADDEPEEDAEAARRAEHEQRIRAVVETVVRKGPAAKDRIVRETTGKAALLRDAVDDAEKRGLLVPFEVKSPGQRARRHYRIGSDPSPNCAAHTLSDSPSGTGRVDPVPALTVPSGPGRHGTGRDGQGREEER